MDFMSSERSARKRQAVPEWNSSGTYARYPVLVSTRYRKPPAGWMGSALLALVAGSVGLAAGLLLPAAPLPTQPTRPALTVSAAEPAASLPAQGPASAAPAKSPAPPPAGGVSTSAAAPAGTAQAAPGPVAPPSDPAASSRTALFKPRSRTADRALELGWDAYGRGRYDRAQELAARALEAVGAEGGTEAQRAQARGLLEQSIRQQQQPPLVPNVVRVSAPQPAPRLPVETPVETPAVVQPEPASQPRVQPALQAQADPAPLPEHSYPRAAARRPSWRPQPQVRRAAGRPLTPPGRLAVVPPGLPPVVAFHGQTSALPPGYRYPQGRGPNECPNYLTVDDCDCHQFENNSWQSMRAFNSQRGPTRQVSRMEAWRRSESLLGRGSI